MVSGPTVKRQVGPKLHVFTTHTGRPIEPRNLYRSFTRVARTRRDSARSGCTMPGTAAEPC